MGPNKKSHAKAGRTNIPFSDKVDIFYVENGSLMQKSATLPHPRTDLAATGLGDCILFGGGTNLSDGIGQKTDVVDIYYPSSDEWKTVNLSEARSSMAATSVGGVRPPRWRQQVWWGQQCR